MCILESTLRGFVVLNTYNLVVSPPIHAICKDIRNVCKYNDQGEAKTYPF